MGRPNNDRIYLGKIREYFEAHCSLPSYSELGKILGFGTKNAAFKAAERLRAAGFLEAGPGGRLVPGRRFFQVPLIDERVPAGGAEIAEFSGALEFRDVRELLVDDASETVLVTIRGDSMIEAGILDGDTAIVRRSNYAEAGDFVVALVDGGYTLKELGYQAGQPVLIPHNRLYKTIVPRADLSLLGVVTGIIRRYRMKGGSVQVRPKRK
ncbi:LexA family protein [Burkholderia ubonensis]|uniref:LexA family protein n=1 Tax=Burkholderia ubonensis TaxID=101571 RepID=UPI0009B2F324|nr:S24 family peptidase [Burkholderia ubonensis]